MSDKWLEWVKRIRAISQAGLTYAKDDFDRERYEELQAISADILAQHSEMEIGSIRHLYKYEQGYQTPKVDVRGVVFSQGKVLMVKEKRDNGWALPGGFCEVGLSPVENIVKEIREEAGYEVLPTRLLAVLDMEKHSHPPQPYHYYKIFIQCKIIGGKAKHSIETSGVNFFEEGRLPNLSLARNTEEQIHIVFQFLKDPKKQSIFD
ncbi:NUDIX hydrolase [Salirhabdus salicampi]|uniref:NUDIX hydrolase n=1 Tax=Salirhabdus salicampi TaxID=476102 RepID=UPI0020C2077E|nr:NUDIX hydrolase [Salirhabdus salicampi]MCP8615405.1 NUDIX hydrolase [Salirhabdus salicampi]